MKHMGFLGAMLLVLLCSAFTMGEPNAPEGYGIGDKATDFSLKNVDGTSVSLSDYPNAKGYLVIFTCNTCPYAQAYEDRIVALDQKYRSKGVPVIAINPNNPAKQPGDSFAAMQQRAKAKGFTFPYVLDEGQKIFPQYGASRTPHVFLLERTQQGNMVRYIGAIDDNYADANAVEEKFVQQAVDALLAGNKIRVTTTWAIGCSIKV